MLTIKTNKNNCKLTYVPLNVNSIVTGETVYDDITITTNSGHNLRENDEVAFIRYDGESISYFKNYGVKDVVNKTGFTVDGFGKYTVEVTGYKPSFVKYSFKTLKIDYSTILYPKEGDPIILTGITALDSNNIVDTITAISISSEIERISDDAFINCKYLKKINVAVNNRNYIAENDVLFNKNKTKLICYPCKKTGSGYKIPATVEKISDYAFISNENLRSVTIPSFVERIGNYTFSGCSNLAEVTCKPTDPPIISDATFNKTALTNIYVKDGQGSRYKTAWKKLKSKISENSRIVDDAKVNQKNTRLHLRDGSLVEITGSTLGSWISENYATSAISVEIGTDVTSIGDATFSACTRLTSVTISNTVTNIGNYAFYGCSNLNFQRIVIPDSVTNIGDCAFSRCTNLRYIYIGKGIKQIGKSAFNPIYHGRQTVIYCEANNPPVLGDSNVFLTSGGEMPSFRVPTDVYNTYRGVYISPNSLINLGDASTMNYICLNTNSHIFVTNKDDVEIRRRYLWDDNNHEFKYDGALRMCDGDYYTFNDLFLIQNSGNTYAINKNITLDITATTAGYDSILLRNCLIGVSYDGKDDKYHIYIPYSENATFINELEERLPVTTFTADDIRFLYNGNDQMKIGCVLQPGTQVNKVCGNIEVDFNIGDSFEVNLHHGEQINNYVDKIKNENINKIIDYERQQYTPMYYSGSIPEGTSVDEYLKEHSDEIDDKLKQVKEINFELNFRTKDFTLYDEDGQEINKESEFTGSTDYIDYGTWQTDDNGYWNNYRLSSDHKKLEYVYFGDNLYGDLLGYLGFTDDDVYYQKDALKKSFLRLSFYDSPNRETQKLLYYSTIYFDTNDLSSRYIKNLNAWRGNSNYTPMYNQLVFAYDIVKKFGGLGTSGLTAQLTCTDKYDDTSSSDGFYIHLFDKLVSGNTCTPIYIKAEFNNAKFGKTVPMIRPISKNTNKPISPTAPAFPREYMKAKKNISGQTYNWTDMEMLLQDMYIKIFIKYDFKTNQYVWFVPQGGLNDTLTFQLFEPRVKGYDFESYSALNGNDPGYGTSDGNPNWYNGEFNDKLEWINSDGLTEAQWARTFNGCCLMTTATTLENGNMLNGTKLFNKSAIKKIDSIWIDGMELKRDTVYDEEKEEYTTNNLQLPDIPFEVSIRGGGTLLWEPPTTNEYWDDLSDTWRPGTKEKIIHSVNYYFKPTDSNVEELFNELYEGIYNDKQKKRLTKTIETTQTTASTLKNSISNVTTGQKLPNGMFAGIRSLRCVKTVDNHGYKFVTIGNGAFNNCQSLIRVNIEPGTAEIIGKNCFSGCRSMKTVNLSDVKVILREAFQGCYTLISSDFAMGNNAKTKYIGCGAFGYTKLRTLELPKTIIRIANSAYRRCYQLEAFSFEENSQLQSIGKRAFGDCAVSKYNLNHVGGDSKYSYMHYGGISRILFKLVNDTNTYVQFYDAMSNKHISLSLSTDKDRGKVLYHYEGNNYNKYVDKKGLYVYSFEDWLKYIF